MLNPSAPKNTYTDKMFRRSAQVRYFRFIGSESYRSKNDTKYLRYKDLTQLTYYLINIHRMLHKTSREHIFLKYT